MEEIISCLDDNYPVVKEKKLLKKKKGKIKNLNFKSENVFFNFRK